MGYGVHRSVILAKSYVEYLEIASDEDVDKALAELNGKTQSTDGWQLDLIASQGVDASRLAQVIQAISKIGQLEWLNYRCSVTGQVSLFTDALIEGGDHLQTVYVYVGDGFDEDSDEMCPTRDNLVAFGDALAHLPRLEVLGLPFYKLVPELTAWKVALPALQRPHNLLKHVVIEDKCPTSKQGKGDITSFLEACAVAKKLEALEICNGYKEACVDAEHMPLVAQLLKTQTLPNLRDLTFSCSSDRGGLIESLETNKKLEGLVVGVGTCDTGLMRLERFYFDEVKAFHALLQSSNLTLSNLTLYPWNFDDSCQSRLNNLPEEMVRVAAIRFFLRLNAEGRNDIMGIGNTAGKTEWIQMIGKWSNRRYLSDSEKLSAVFYYLQQNPSLCNGDTGLHHLFHQPEGIDLETQTFRVLVSEFARLAAEAAEEAAKKRRAEEAAEAASKKERGWDCSEDDEESESDDGEESGSSDEEEEMEEE